MMRTAVLLACLAMTPPGHASTANQIERACLKSERDVASRRLCGCIQTVANQFLAPRDQRLAASFFSDPHMAQEIRQSDRRSHEVFWERYKKFGETAADYCGTLTN